MDGARTMKRCADCCHYSKSHGECRHNPPALRVDGTHEEARSGWPKVREEAWCGKFERHHEVGFYQVPRGDE